MSSLNKAKFGSAALVSSLLLNFVFVSCSADAITNPMQTSDPATLAKLGEIAVQLDSIQSQIERQSRGLVARIDSLDASITSSGGGEVMPPAMAIAQLDSIMALASWIADDMSSPGGELCAAVELGFEAGPEWEAEASAEAAGGVGAWAGSGAFANVLVNLKNNMAGEIKLSVTPSWTGCIPLGDDPTTRPASTALAARAPGIDQLEPALTSLAGQLGWDGSLVGQALNTAGTAIQSPSSVGIRDLGGFLPLPAGWASLANDPIGTIGSEIQGYSQDMVDVLLCGGIDWGSTVGTVVADACNLFPANLPTIAELFQLTDNFGVLEATVAVMNTSVNAACDAIDFVGVSRLFIPGVTITEPLFNSWSVTTPPVFNARLFPSYRSPC